MNALLTVFSGPYAMLARLGTTLLLALALFGYGYFRGNVHGTAKLDAYKAAQVTQRAKVIVKQGAATERVVTRYVQVAGKTKTVTETIEKEVVRYENAKLDTCPLSVAAVSLHDAAAANTLPDAAKSVDGTASGIEAAALTETCAANYAEYHKVANRLRAFQDWVREQAAVK